ncbi:glycosyltransferase [Myroides marinus]|uniref:glycosyltransferase n=1 Tax=Myroides marinus TaxID=703342 RepID=UPI002578BEDA|nr:glycosyltransferase [Myroides marinus]MDM1380711.1 glycosyltransferase [Myroides marinus]MDM1387975.1 glycosyltransferase [Myroides marinus]MDM1395195.1 glycosyltransferase [Myroides marinus]
MKDRICIVLPTLCKGGMERVVSVLANNMIERDINVDVVCLISGENVEYELDPRINIHFPPFKYTPSLKYKIKCVSYLIKKLKLLKPSSVLAFSEVFNPLSIIACKLSNVKVYISDRSSPDVVYSKVMEFLRKMTYPFSNGIIAQTQYAKDVFERKRFNNNIKVIGNPIRNINDNYVNENGKVVVSVGRLVKSKNFHELIDIFIDINKMDWELWIIGDGPLYNELDAYIKEKCIIGNIKLLGKKDDIDFYFSKASIFAFTSLSEGFPNAVAEALAYPLLTISYNCVAGPADLIDDTKNGYLIDIDDKKGFANRLNRMMEEKGQLDEVLRRSKEVRKRFSASFITEIYLKFIRNK